MRLWKIIASLTLSLMLVLTLLPTTATAAGNGDSISFDDLLAAAAKKKCGEDLTWKLDNTGTLTISGTGPMTDYTNGSDVPWYAQKDTVKTVVIEAGVTSIGDHAFDGCENLTDVYYNGTQTQWTAVVIGSNNEALLAAHVHCADEPTVDLDRDGMLTTDDAVYLLLFVMFGAEDYSMPDGVELDFDNSAEVITDDAVYLLLHVMFGAEDYPLY